MATYKLIQNIEADDHILGPLTLRQFVFALITAFLLYLNFLCIAKGIPFLLLFLLPPTALMAFFAFPFSGDQPTEIWALAKIRFMFKPRQRLWNQSGVKELVTITVPKKVERVYTDGLSQIEVRSRLKALANTIDSRGWAVKNVSADTYVHNAFDTTDSDRLVNVNDMAQEVPAEEQPVDFDMFDGSSSAIAQQVDSMMDQSAKARRQTLLDQMSAAAPAPVMAAPATVTQQGQSQPADYWFAQSPVPTAAPAQPVIPAPVVDNSLSPAEEQAIDDQLHQRADTVHASYNNMRTLQPAGPRSQTNVQPPVAAPVAAAIPVPAVSRPPAPDPAILSLASNDDLSVATLAREAQKSKGDDEVVISLH
jgi:hypothetical protein